MRPAFASYAPLWLQRFRPRSVRRCHFRGFVWTVPLLQTERKWSTPLAKQLFEAISTTGPVPLASYMRMCLTSDLGGYYTGAIDQSRDQFGAKGDFVTSPEISQVFGELVGIWFVAEWMSQGRPTSGVQLIEVGPGRGTLMDDMLRTIQRFPAMSQAVDEVCMVEASKELRLAQQRRLCGSDAPISTSEAGFRGTGKHLKKPVVWVDSIKSIPVDPNRVPFIVAHEFFDALPIHSFQSALQQKPAASTTSTPNTNPSSSDDSFAEPLTEWREMIVSTTHPAAVPAEPDGSPTAAGESSADFQLILSSGTTRHSRYLPESSPRYRNLKQTPGTIVEICPDASLYVTDFATRIGGSAQVPKAKPSGAALILDYGPSDTVPINSLRGIHQHQRVNPFSSPGQVDLSADVDFTAIAEAATLASDGVEVHGPICQADFLELLGIRERARMLTNAPGADPATVMRVDKAWKRLVDRGPGGMGKVYKALAILPENEGRRRPAGFGGDVIGS